VSITDSTVELTAEFTGLGITPAKHTAKIDASKLLSTASKNRPRLRTFEAARLGT
jgi:hypothetical protein